MGKNTMMKRSIRLYCEQQGSDKWTPLIDELVGNVGVIFTKGRHPALQPRHLPLQSTESIRGGAVFLFSLHCKSLLGPC